MKVRITKLPVSKAAYGKQVDGSLSLRPTSFGGVDYEESLQKKTNKVKNTLTAVPRTKANLEAEGGETAFGPISGQSIPDHMKIIGKRHTDGGVPLNLPDDTFIFSDTAALKINDPSVLAMFNKIPKKGGYTPAELAKPYDINKYKNILYDKDTSKLERNTATIMIKNYIMKLGALALVQESMKGFPQGIPEMARPYMEANGITEEELIPELKEQADAMKEQNMMRQSLMGESPQGGMPEEGMMQEPSYPEEMPSGAPVASPEMLAQMEGQQMPPEMMQPPMAKEGYIQLPYAQPGIEVQQFTPLNQHNKSYDEIERDNAEFMEKVRDVKIPFIGKKDRYLEDMKAAEQLGITQEPWFNMGLSNQDLKNYYNAFDQNVWKNTYAPVKVAKFSGGGLVKAQGGLTVTPEMQNEIDTKWAGDTEAYLKFQRLKQRLTTDSEFKINLFKKYEDVIENPENYTGNKKDKWYNSLTSQTPEIVLQALLDQEERNRRLEAFGKKYNYDAGKTDQSANAPGRMTNKQTVEFIKQHPGLQDLDFSKGYLSQAAYIAYDDYMNELGISNKGIDPTGVEDELPGRHGGKISGIDNQSTNTTLKQFVYELDDEEVQEEPGIPKTKEVLTCRCTDPQTGETIEFPVNSMDECECAGEKGQLISNPLQLTPHWSIPAKRNILRNALMQVNPAGTNVVLPGSTEIPGAYEEYQTKVDQALAGMNQMGDAIMQGVSGPIGVKQAMMRDLLGQGINTASAAVADVMSRNVDRQRETNQQNATIANANMLARAAALQEALEAQRVRRDTRTANVNKRLYNTMGAMIEADKEMALRQQMNTTTPQYVSEYDYGFITPTGALRPFTGETGDTFEDRIKYYLSKTGDYNKAFDMAWKEARLNKSKKGGFVLGTNAFPFMI